MSAGVPGLFTHKQNSSGENKICICSSWPFFTRFSAVLGLLSNSENQSAGSGVSFKSSVWVIPTQQCMLSVLYFIPPGLSGCVNAISRCFGFNFLVSIVEGFGEGLSCNLGKLYIKFVLEPLGCFLFQREHTSAKQNAPSLSSKSELTTHPYYSVFTEAATSLCSNNSHTRIKKCNTCEWTLPWCMQPCTTTTTPTLQEHILPHAILCYSASASTLYIPTLWLKQIHL